MSLTTQYLGLTLRSPFVIGASPFCDSLEVARRLEAAGAAAVVMRSLFEEQIVPPPKAAPRRREPSESLPEFPDYADYQLSPNEYLRQLERLKRTLGIPVIASLNGHQRGGWMDFASRIESAGADAIELNFYQVVTDPAIPADQVESEMLETAGIVCGSVKIPVAANLSPFHASVAQLAVALELEGIAGIVVFNRFYQPDIDLEGLGVQPLLRLSEPSELRLRWLAILSPQLRGSLAATGGIHTAEGVVKALLTGAHAVQLVSAPLRYGPGIISTLHDEVEAWIKAHGYGRIDDLRGQLNLSRCPDASAFERANYIRVLQSWKA